MQELRTFAVASAEAHDLHLDHTHVAQVQRLASVEVRLVGNAFVEGDRVAQRGRETVAPSTEPLCTQLTLPSAT